MLHLEQGFCMCVLWGFSNISAWSFGLPPVKLKASVSLPLFHRTERQHHDLAYCLTLLPLTERGLRKMQDNFDCFADKLQDAAVYNCFLAALGRLRRVGTKPEMKVRGPLFSKAGQGIFPGEGKGKSESLLLKAQLAVFSFLKCNFICIGYH